MRRRKHVELDPELFPFPWQDHPSEGLDVDDPLDLRQLGLYFQVCQSRISWDLSARSQPCPHTFGFLLACSGSPVPPWVLPSQRNTFCEWGSRNRLRCCCAHSLVASSFQSRSYGCISLLVVISPQSNCPPHQPHATWR